MNVVKRDNVTMEPFNATKIYNAIMRAMQNGSGIVRTDIAHKISNNIQDSFFKADKTTVNIVDIESMVFQGLIDEGESVTAKAYEAYRAVQSFKRNRTMLDKTIEGIIDGTNIDAIDENSNKNASVASTQRDLIAGEFSRDYCRRNLLPSNVMYAHDEGMIHFHDADYFIQHIPNCCLVNLKDMFKHGTVINRKMIETPKSFQVACTVATQIVQQVANGQYGGQTISVAHLAPFVRISKEKWVKKVTEDAKQNQLDETLSKEDLKQYIENVSNNRLKEEISAGIQTIQYQVNTFATSNGGRVQFSRYKTS